VSTLKWKRDPSDRKVRIAKYHGRTIRMTRGNDCHYARVGAHVISRRFAYEAENAIKLYINEQRTEEPVPTSDTELIKQLREGAPDQRDWKTVNALMLKAADRLATLAHKAKR
jgi:hypothetical protein